MTRKSTIFLINGPPPHNCSAPIAFDVFYIKIQLYPSVFREILRKYCLEPTLFLGDFFNLIFNKRFRSQSWQRSRTYHLVNFDLNVIASESNWITFYTMYFVLYMCSSNTDTLIYLCKITICNKTLVEYNNKKRWSKWCLLYERCAYFMESDTIKTPKGYKIFLFAFFSQWCTVWELNFLVFFFYEREFPIAYSNKTVDTVCKHWRLIRFTSLLHATRRLKYIGIFRIIIWNLFK